MLPLRSRSDHTLARDSEPSPPVGLRTGAEGDLGGAQALALEQPALALRAAGERGEIDALEARVVGGDVRQRKPQRALALDAEREHLELEHTAQGRIARDPAVELRAPGLLRQPAGPYLQGVAVDAETRHDV